MFLGGNKTWPGQHKIIGYREEGGCPEEIVRATPEFSQGQVNKGIDESGKNNQGIIDRWLMEEQKPGKEDYIQVSL